MNWRNRTSKLLSRGSTSEKAVSLGDLHRRRQETQSQYFTPDWVARGIWEVLGDALENSGVKDNRRVSVLDTSVGSGRLFAGAPASRLALFGVDTDDKCINALQADAKAAGLEFEFATGSMADLRASGFDVAVINPPFSLRLDSPNLTPYECTSFGRFGRGTSACSHEYALEQALDAATFVAAVLPVSMEPICRAKQRLSSIAYLPGNAFLAEGANVECAVFFFGSQRSKRIVEVANISDETSNWPKLEKANLQKDKSTNPHFSLKGYDCTTPAITLPVTGNKRVELHHYNRRITLKYNCGLVQAKVSNGLLGWSVDGHRLSSTLPFHGSGRFLIDVLLMQENPEGELNKLADDINRLGGDAWISPTLKGFYAKLVKRHKRAATPMRRYVKVANCNHVKLEALQNTFLETGNFNGPSICKGDVITAQALGGAYEISHNGITVTVRRDLIHKRYKLLSDEHIAENEWQLKFEGLPHHFPKLAHQYKQEIVKQGIDWLADFQELSMIEGLISPYGYIGAWEQGSGKARYALALALLEPGRNLIVVDSGLLPEMLREIMKIGLNENSVRVLKRGEIPTSKISLTTYRELRKGTPIKYTKTVWKDGEQHFQQVKKIIRTSAEQWRRMFHTVICDEGGILSNSNTQQTGAVKRLAGRKLIVLDGTPQNNYPRDLLPISVISAGNATSHQPYGTVKQPYLHADLKYSTDLVRRGEDVFFDDYVVTQWVTNEFRDDLRSGAKREVPKINNVDKFRDWLAPNLQRRLRDEPELAIFQNCPKPTRQVHQIDWDTAHFQHYLRVANDFAQWYRQTNQTNRKSLNLVTVLSRIGAVQRAANSPHVEGKNSMAIYEPLTSKQKWALSRIHHWVTKGKKTILYAKSPDVLARLQQSLIEDGISSVLFTGDINIEKRNKALTEEFRFGDCPVLLSSWVGQRGLNLEQAGAVVFYERSWSATTEEQAIFRTQRPSQTQKVAVEYGHLKGSIDEYCAQLVEWKKRSAEAGLDYGDQVDDEEEFMHLDTLLNQFCNDVFDLSAANLRQKFAA